MRIIILVLGLLFSVFNIYAQRIQHLKKGNSFYKEKDYRNAIMEYEKLWYSSAGAKLLGVDAKMNLANCYRVMDDPFRAQKLYMQVMRYAEDRLPVYLEYGKVLMSLGRYEAAIKQFELYAQKNTESEEPALLIQQCKDIKNIEPLFSRVELTNQIGINDSSSRQIGLAYYGDAVVYASDELDAEVGDLRTTNYLNMRACGIDAEGNLKKSEKFSLSLNGPDRHDGPAAFSRDGAQIFYSQSVPTRDGGSVLQIWQAYFRDGNWSDPKPLQFMLTGYNYTHPTLSADGRTLYFASDMKGALGGLDIWVTHFEEGRWTLPQNLGKDINTPKDDAWPFIHPDGDLYFSSKGHPGFGGYDIFRTRPLGNGVDWLAIENLGLPFNSSFSDISFIISDDQTEGFFASNRSRSYDIFKYVLEGAEKQSLPDDVQPRKKVGLSEIEHPVKLDSDFPVQPDDMTDVEYVEHLKKLAEAGQLDLPDADGAATENKEGTTETPVEENPTEEPEVDPTIIPGGDPMEKPMMLPEENPTEDPVENPTTNPTSEEIILAVVLKVIDIRNSSALPKATVIVKNKFTQKEEVLFVNDKGEVEVLLEADQKYTLTGRCIGYKDSSLPVSTMGVTESDRVQADIPMEKE